MFSGIKIDKLDDLDAMIARGKINPHLLRWFTRHGAQEGGSVARWTRLPTRVTEDPAHADKPYYIPPDRIEQAKRMVQSGRQQGIEFVLPIDFTLADGSVVTALKPGDQQFDIGPQNISFVC